MHKSMTLAHTRFDRAQITACVEKATELGALPETTPTVFDNYQEYATAIPVLDREQYRTLAARVVNETRKERFYIGATSGSSGSPRLVLSRSGLRRGEGGPNDVDLVKRLRQAGCFVSGDVVANLFAVEQFSILHHGACRLLEALDVDIVPPGRLESGRLGESQLALLCDLQVNVLFGTPSSIIQVARAAQSSSRRVAFDRIVFTGEALGPTKRKWLKSIFGEYTRVFGLYGLSECGFIGISRESEENYLIRDTSYFVENTVEHGIVVTSLDTRAPIPILRYRTGDVGTLDATEADYILGSVTRAGTDFNYMGNLVSYEAIKNVANRVIGTSDFSMQLHLSTDAHGADALTVCILEETETREIEEALTNALLQMPEIREGYEKTAGRVKVIREPWAAAKITARQKEALVIDER